MNQKGFATILGLCLIMAIALCVKGIQEAETNHIYETMDFQTEIDLQNAAENGIYAAAEKVHRKLAMDKNYLPLIKNSTRSNHQVNVISTTQKTSSGDISVNVWAERVLIFPYEVNYSMIVSGNKTKAIRVNDGKTKREREVYTLSSSAEVDSERIGRKLSRHAFAYVELIAEDKSDTTVHFMNNAPDNLYYQPNDPTK